MAQVYFAAPAQATPVDRQALRDAWIALLGRWEWEWFCTFTFRDMVHPEAADKRFRVLISQANRVLYGIRWHKQGQGLRWCRALEYQKRDVIHYHALIAGVQDLRRLTWMDRWYEMDPRAHLRRNLRFRPPENSWRLYEPDFDFLDDFFGRFLTPNSLLNEP